MNEADRRWQHSWLRIDRELRPLIAERLEHGATDELDRKLAALIEEQRRVERADWFS
jgi:hypothetical protein